MKVLYLMRGLPACGKSFTAKELVGDGVIFSTDDYWYQVVKPDEPDQYSFNPRMLGQAHKWNQLRAQKAIEEGTTPIIIDNTNTTASEGKIYVQYALPQGYEIEVREPTSEWWLEIRELLQDKKANKKALKNWAIELEERSKETHGVPAWSIEKMMWRWQNDITVEDIMNARDM